ncbi:arsenate reductase (glutaredoxin) [Citrobacter sp. JGM124]|uniref:arsenate reductase (glutaredoxin) n=1 Tax=Citrobacter sp. JGM124 TaxID=2799789 RepID=UPI001BA98193|nr:arsenate reductase (glutaredoxin) [Citrobacter sp. JGM124]MBS0848912.1 arsenate reductase (glutaredoxin) [Citrobacter sp. JGM124]
MSTIVTLYHNPRCSKSRETLTLLQESGVSVAIIRYLETPPDAATLKHLLEMLSFTDARQLMRRKETLYTTLQLDNPALSQDELLQTMVENPILIERPIAVAQGRARIGRPPEQVLEIIGG